MMLVSFLVDRRRMPHLGADRHALDAVIRAPNRQCERDTIADAQHSRRSDKLDPYGTRLQMNHRSGWKCN